MTKRLEIGRALNGLPATSEESGLWIEEGEVRVAKKRIQETPRVGVDFAGPEWAAMPWRFVMDGAKTERRKGSREGRTTDAKGTVGR